MASIALQDWNLQIVHLDMDLIRISRKKEKDYYDISPYYLL